MRNIVLPDMDFLAEQRYGTLGSCPAEQVGGFDYCPNPPTNTAHPNIDVLEAFNPDLGSDPFKWIPKGLMQDLINVQAELEMHSCKIGLPSYTNQHQQCAIKLTSPLYGSYFIFNFMNTRRELKPEKNYIP